MSKYGVVNNFNGTVTINEDYFDELLNDALFLSILESHGVDNWEGYSEAQAEYYSDDEDE
jgi:hypothetical protein